MNKQKVIDVLVDNLVIACDPNHGSPDISKNNQDMKPAIGIVPRNFWLEDFYNKRNRLVSKVEDMYYFPNQDEHYQNLFKSYARHHCEIHLYTHRYKEIEKALERQRKGKFLTTCFTEFHTCVHEWVHEQLSLSETIRELALAEIKILLDIMDHISEDLSTDQIKTVKTLRIKFSKVKNEGDKKEKSIESWYEKTIQEIYKTRSRKEH